VNVREARINAARILGNAALAVGFAVALVATVYAGALPLTEYFFAVLLVHVGLGLRLEAAIMYRP
jgi:uncharacterized membrane protein YiaA